MVSYLIPFVGRAEEEGIQRDRQINTREKDRETEKKKRIDDDASFALRKHANSNFWEP